MEPALLVLWIRRSIPESEAFLGQRNGSAQPGIPHLTLGAIRCILARPLSMFRVRIASMSPTRIVSPTLT
jgi:hypothetical protein